MHYLKNKKREKDTKIHTQKRTNTQFSQIFQAFHYFIYMYVVVDEYKGKKNLKKSIIKYKRFTEKFKPSF